MLYLSAALSPLYNSGSNSGVPACHDSPLSDGTSYTRRVSSTATPCCSLNISARPTHARPIPAHSHCCCCSKGCWATLLSCVLPPAGVGPMLGSTIPRVVVLQEHRQEAV